MTARIRFENVGAQHLTWDVVMTLPLSEDLLRTEIRRRGALGSREIDITENGETRGGIYVGVFRKVGTWRVLQVES